MVGESPRGLYQRLRQFVASCRASDKADAQLLAAYVSQHDEGAFEALIHRHGGMVLGVCRRLLADPQEVEDAFQATFLLLVSKCRCLRQPERLASWLYGVSYRVAVRARKNGNRRRQRHSALTEVSAPPPADVPGQREMLGMLDEEITRLPAKYRLPILLCYLEGKTNEEAARLLQCPRGTIAIRLARARKRLLARLARRGAGWVGSSAGALLTTTALSHAAPAALVNTTLQTVQQFGAHAVRVPIGVHILVRGVMQDMLLQKTRRALTLALAMMLVSLSLFWGIVQSLNGATAPSAELPQNVPSDKSAQPATTPAEKNKAAGEWKLIKSFQAGTGEVHSVAVAPLGQWVATFVPPNFDDILKNPNFAEPDAAFKLWDPASGTTTPFSSMGVSTPTPLAFSSDGAYLAFGTTEICIYDMKKKKLTHTLPQVISAWHVTFSHDNKNLVVVRGDGHLRLYEVPQYKLIASGPAHQQIAATAAFRQDEKLLITAGYGGDVKTWSLTKGSLIKSTKFALDNTCQIVLAPNGQSLACGSFGGGIKVWDLATEKLTTSIAGADDRITPVQLAFSSDGRTLAAGYKDGSVILWDANSGARLANLKGHQQPVSALSFSAEGQFLVSADMKGVTVLWRVAGSAASQGTGTGVVGDSTSGMEK